MGPLGKSAAEGPPTVSLATSVRTPPLHSPRQGQPAAARLPVAPPRSSAPLLPWPQADLEKGTDINAYSSRSCEAQGCGPWEEECVVWSSFIPGAWCRSVPRRAGLEAGLACKLPPINKQVVPVNAVESL